MNLVSVTNDPTDAGSDLGAAVLCNRVDREATSRAGMLDSSSRYIPTLDGWRAVSILAVIICHGRDTLFGLSGWWQSPGLLSWAAEGRLGVDLFFAISGFLITRRLLEEADRDGRFNLSRFYIRRAFRILPPCWLYLATLAIAGAVGLLSVGVNEILDCLLFIRNYTIQTEVYYTGHFWSLAVEEHFYLLWPMLLFLLRPRQAAWLVPVLGIAVHIWRGMDSRYHVFAAFFPDAGVGSRTDTRIDALLWGCEAALLMPFFDKLRTRRWLSWSWAVLVSVLASVVAFSAPMLPLWLALGFPLLIVSTVLFPDGICGRLLEWSPIRLIGRMSYSLYLWQTLLLTITDDSDAFFGCRVLKEWPWNLLVIFGIAWLSFCFVERPMIRLGHWLTKRRRPAARTCSADTESAPVADAVALG